MPATPFYQQQLSTSDGHALYVAQYGNPDAPAAVVLHGGPGSGTSPSVLDWFDLERQRVVLFDQRGAGQSRPHGAILHNDSHKLVDDIELLRMTLGIQRWMVVGGSWGATLALLYAGRHVERVQSLVLRGSFLASAREMQWFFQSLRALLPQGWDNLTRGWHTGQKEQVLKTLCAMLLQGDAAQASEAAQRWSDYEDDIMRVMAGSAQTENRTTNKASERVLGKYRLQAHYLSQGCFTSERSLFRMARRLREVPAILIHGTHDLVCPPENAQRLQRFMPQAQMRWIMKGTHTPADTAIAQALKEAVRDLAQ